MAECTIKGYGSKTDSIWKNISYRPTLSQSPLQQLIDGNANQTQPNICRKTRYVVEQSFVTFYCKSGCQPNLL